MAKGDSNDAQNAINTQGNLAQNNLNNTRGNALPQNQNLQNMWQTQMGNAGDQFNSILGNYQQFLNRAPNQTNFNNEYGGYQNFANTGGFSDQDKQDIRARNVAPTRAVYGNAQENINRQRSLQGGYSPNYTAATTKMARDLGQSVADTNTNTNAGIAQMVQQGKLAGLGGMSGIDQSRLAAELQNSGMNLGAMQGMTGLYGATPGQAGLTGGMLNASNANLTNQAALQNQLSLGIMGNQIQKSQIPGNYQNALGNIGGTLGLVGQVGRALGGMGVGGGNSGSLTPGTGVGTEGLGGPTGMYSSGLTGPISGMPMYDPMGNPISGGMMSNGGYSGMGTQSNPWWKSLFPGSPGNGQYSFQNDMTNPNSWLVNNPNAGAMNPYYGGVFGGGGQGGFKGGAGGPV